MLGVGKISEWTFLIFGGYNGKTIDDCYSWEVESNACTLATKLEKATWFYDQNSRYILYKCKIMIIDDSKSILTFDITHNKWNIVKFEEWSKLV